MRWTNIRKIAVSLTIAIIAAVLMVGGFKPEVQHPWIQ